MRRIWLAATALVLAGGAISLVLASTSSATVEVQIEARRLDDGRTEFALNYNGERILPSTRYFPAEPGHSRWLHSSTIELEVNLPEPDPTASQEAASASSGSTGGSSNEPQPSVQSTSSYEPYSSIGSNSVGNYWQSVSLDDFTDDLNTSIAVDATSGSWDSYADPPIMWFSCWSGQLRLWFSELPLSDIGTVFDGEYAVTYRASTLPAGQGTWSAGDYTAEAPLDVAVSWLALAGTYYNLRFIGFSDSVSAKFETDEITSLPAWGNITHCGEY